MKRAGGHQVSGAIGQLEPAVSTHQISVISAHRFWQIAALTVAGTIGFMAQADAALLWSDDDAGYSRPVQVAPQRVQRTRHRAAKQLQTPIKEAAKPQGPLIISISISRQNLRIYDANGFFAETPISTGMAGHPTPMGAFSVIQKQKLHHSNIYSGAPMPFMQRITWSGIAMHAGVLPGYPASHGCIRMPMAFAVKMYGWTKMGARVVVTPGELTPASFSHPLLATQKVVPQPVAADMPRADATAKGDKSAATEPASKSETSVASLDLRLSIGHDSRMPAAMDAPKPLTEPTRTADASSSPAITTSVTMSDAAPSASPESRNAALSASAAPAAEDAVSDQATGATPEPKSGAAKSAARVRTSRSRPSRRRRPRLKSKRPKSSQRTMLTRRTIKRRPASTARKPKRRTTSQRRRLLLLPRPSRSQTKVSRQRSMSRQPTPTKIRLARPIATRRRPPSQLWQWQRAPGQFRCSSAARTVNCMYGRISRRCSTFP